MPPTPGRHWSRAGDGIDQGGRLGQHRLSLGQRSHPFGRPPLARGLLGGQQRPPGRGQLDDRLPGIRGVLAPSNPPGLEQTESSARASLRSAIWALRSAFGPAAGTHLVADRESVELAGPELRVDVREFATLIADGRAADAVGLCRGPLLNRLDEDWVFTAREEHDAAVALGTLTRTAAQAGDFAAAVAWARRRVALRPLERARRRAT